MKMVKTRCALALVATFLVMLVGGCGADDETTSSEATSSTDAATVELQGCPNIGPEKLGAAQIAAGYSGKVIGISCREAGRYIRDRFIGGFHDSETRQTGSVQEQIAAGAPGAFTSTGFECQYRPLRDESGWGIECQRGDQVVAFTFTP